MLTLHPSQQEAKTVNLLKNNEPLESTPFLI